jgi:hypothetical protein
MNDNERNEAKSQFVLMKVLVSVFIIPPLIVNEFERKYTKTLAILEDIFHKSSRVTDLYRILELLTECCIIKPY